MIEVDHLSRYYGQHRAVDDVSFQIGDNTVVGFLGLNGAGKTTTLKVIAGLLPPSAGTVRVDGVDMATAPESFRKSIGFLPETPPLYVEQYGHPMLRRRHLPFPIGSDERDQWMRCMVAALADSGLDEAARQHLVGSFFNTADFMRNREDPR